MCEVPEGHLGRGADQNIGDIEARALFGPDGCGKTPYLDKLGLEELANRSVNRGFTPQGAGNSI